MGWLNDRTRNFNESWVSGLNFGADPTHLGAVQWPFVSAYRIDSKRHRNHGMV